MMGLNIWFNPFALKKAFLSAIGLKESCRKLSLLSFISGALFKVFVNTLRGNNSVIIVLSFFSMGIYC